jgi:hypothetical protein
MGSGCATLFQRPIARGEAAKQLKKVAVVSVYTNSEIKDADTREVLAKRPKALASKLMRSEVNRFLEVPNWQVLRHSRVQTSPFFRDFRRRQESRLSKAQKSQISAVAGLARTPLRREDVLLHRNIKHLRWLASNLEVDGVAVIELKYELKEVSPGSFQPIVHSSIKIVDPKGRLAVATADPASGKAYTSNTVLSRSELTDRKLSAAFQEAVRESALDLATRIREELPYEQDPTKVAEQPEKPLRVSQVRH